MLERITNKLSLVQGKNNGRFPYSHSILIFDQKRPTLIDTGCGIDILKDIRKKYEISCIVNSHTHPDHSAGNWLFKTDQVSIHEPEEGIDTSGNIFALSERLAEPGELATYWRRFAASTMDFADCNPTHSYDEKTIFEFGDVILEPVHTPGHTADHYCFYEPNDGILFAFDYDLTSFGPWYGHRESSIPDFKKSIEKIKQLDIKILVSGHKGIINGNISDQINRFSKKFDERDQKIIELLQSENRTIDQLVEKAPIYGQYPYAEPLLRYWEEQMITKHLVELEKQEKIAKEKNGKFSVK
ncbi:MAG: MBL fold metallo-hydrolase [Candidatus Odinarchaeota archaeon]